MKTSITFLALFAGLVIVLALIVKPIGYLLGLGVEVPPSGFFSTYWVPVRLAVGFCLLCLIAWCTRRVLLSH